jgi:parallel beta helix pectate lyase-like protein
MNRLCRIFLAAVFAASAFAAHAQTPACTTTLSPGGDITGAVDAAAPGAVICLNPGTYTPAAGHFPDANTFTVGNKVTLIGLGTNPSQVVLQGGAAGPYVMYVVSYQAGKSAAGSTIQNLTLTGAKGGIQLNNFIAGTARLTDVTVKDVVVNTPVAGGGSVGVLLQNVDRINIDGVSVTSGSNGFYLINTTSSLIMNSTVVRTLDNGTSGIAVLGGGNNVIANNTVGSNVVWAIPGDGVNFYNTIGNRFEGNLVQGFRDNGIDVHATPLTGTLPAPQDTQNSTDNYIGKNTVAANNFANGQPAGAAIWSNCGSDRTWIFANDASGVPECGTCVYSSRNNMVLANNLHNNGITGFLLSGGQEVLNGFCPIPAYQVKPVSTFVQSNSAFFNKRDQTFFRSADTTQVTRNFMSPHNGFAGPLRTDPCVTPSCQSAITLDAAAGASTAGYSLTLNGMRIAANTNHDNLLGLSSDNTSTSGVDFTYNRWIQPAGPNTYNRFLTGSALTWDGGSQVTGGNYWSVFPSANGNPGNVPYAGVFANLSNGTGPIVDRFPYKTEDFGRGPTVTVFEPLSPGAGASIAMGTRRVVRWYSPGCVYNDVVLDGAITLASMVPNTGYAVVTIPSTTVASHSMVVNCRDSAGTLKGNGVSLGFKVTDNTLQLMAPGRDDVFDAGSQIVVGWKKAATITSVIVELSTDGGVTFTTLGTFTGTMARVTLPAGAAHRSAVIRVRSTTPATIDTMDGTFSIRGTGAAFTNVASGRQFKLGELERLEWSSPVGSRLVTVTATVAGVTKTVAQDLPDRGSFDWIVPEFTGGVMTLSATFKNAAGATLSTVTNSLGATSGPTTITFSGVPATLAPGASVAITATASSGVAVTLTSATPTVCTVSGSTVTGAAIGTCTINGNAAASGAFGAATNSASFLVSTDPPRLANISTRMEVLTGSNVMIAGFVIGGSTSKTVAILAQGPSLIPAGIPNALPNPTMQLVRSSDGAVIATNDDWGTDPNAAQLQAKGLAPPNPLESGLLVTLPPGAYTVVISGVGGSVGVGLVGVFEVDHPETPLINISTRGLVLTGGDVMIGGFIVQGSGPQTVVVQAIGPSLVAAGIPNALPNPTLQLVRSSDGAVIATNDDWQTGPNAAQIQAKGLAPGNAAESAIMMSLPPGAYTAIVSGVGGQTGVGIVAVYTTN